MCMGDRSPYKKPVLHHFANKALPYAPLYQTSLTFNYATMSLLLPLLQGLLACVLVQYRKRTPRTSPLLQKYVVL